MTRIRKLLIANRGEIASRIIATARRLDIATVAIYSDSDADAPYVKEADEAVALIGNAPSETYLRSDLIVAAALRTNCQAIHPGYGFLSENAPFADACAAAGLIFVGPPPEAIAAMGSKIIAKDLMKAAGVPILAGITISDGEEIGADLTARAEVEVGFPLLVKAAYGGGGRGMRAVDHPGELLGAIASARREAASAFGNGTVFLEHYVQSPRHIEVQIFADTHGNAVHLFERECSIQRRYQKIIEEAPSVAIDEELRAELGSAALKAARAIGYVGAGTVEFVMGSDRRFFFLEVNTRLQVEHPVTESVTGLDLVNTQIRLAAGEKMPFDQARASEIHFHSIEHRINAEDPEHNFAPSPGKISEVVLPGGCGVRLDTHLYAGYTVPSFYDSLIAKLIVFASDRGNAVKRSLRALSELETSGIKTTRDFHKKVLSHPDFLSGDFDTSFVEKYFLPNSGH